MPLDAPRLFLEAYGGKPEIVVRAPGRVNLIGEHTDYNDGFVLPAAIDLELSLACRRRDDGAIRLMSREAAPESGFERYVDGVGELLGLPVGVEGVIASDIPLGGGLSSSAALELAVARALVAANGEDWRPVRMAKLAQRAEIEYVGNRCGIMDQLAVACGQADMALLIDCRSLEITASPLPVGVAIVVCDTGKPRQLVESAYNERRASCESAARQLGLASLRDATLGDIRRLPQNLAKRALHVVSENKRVLDFVAAMQCGDLQSMGRLLFASHDSLRDLYEVSCPELNVLVELAGRLPGCIGSRLTGAGFGGCTVSLVRAEQGDRFASELVSDYRRRTGLPGRAWVCRAVPGCDLLVAHSGLD
jgi:galactokinase